MLKSVRLQNFFGFQDCTINLEKGANVLVGINGSGKSNFFKAIELLSKCKNKEAFIDLVSSWGGPDIISFADSTKDNSPSLLYEYDVREMHPVSNHNLEYSISLVRNRIGLDSYSLIEKLKDQEYNKGFQFQRNGDSVINTIFDDHEESIRPSTHNAPVISEIENLSGEIRETLKLMGEIHVYLNINTNVVRKGSPPSSLKYLSENIENLASLLEYFLRSDRKTHDTLIKSIQTINENFESFYIAARTSGYKDIDITEKKLNRNIPATHISDGTLKFLCLMAILYNPNRGSVVCIDEPEVGLHPDMINTLHEAIEFASETSQVIISTHSAHLLDYFNLKQIRVFEKDENNATVVRQYADKDFEGWYETFNPGQMWRAGNIGGNRW